MNAGRDDSYCNGRDTVNLLYPGAIFLNPFNFDFMLCAYLTTYCERTASCVDARRTLDPGPKPVGRRIIKLDVVTTLTYF